MKFGELFRKLRKASGTPSLREFCRQNGFDAPNISRLERSLVRPPQSEAILKTYAKALKMQEGSSEWDRFIELAALENDMLPSQIKNSQILSSNFPEVLKRYREERKYPGSWVTAIQLEGWAETSDAAFSVPRLIRRLILASVDQNAVTLMDFPADEGVWKPSLDGTLNIVDGKGNAFIPDGVSAWEMSAQKKDISGKADSDFDKRTKNPPSGIDPRQTVFVFFTPHKWAKKNEWREEKKKLNIWKDVRVYDSTIVEEWFEVARAADIWFSKLIGRRPENITDICDHWENLATLSNPRFKPAVFMASRDSAAIFLKEWFAGPPKTAAIEGHSPNEVIDFVAAYTASLSADQRVAIELKTVIVEDQAAWKFLSSASGKFFLIPKPSLEIEPEAINGAVRQGHHVLMVLPRLLDDHSHKLSRVHDYDLEKALADSDFLPADAKRLAKEAGGSLTILKRRLPGYGKVNIPAWTKSHDAKFLLPILLVGRWDDSLIADQKAITALGKPYQEVLEAVNHFRTVNDPVVMKSNSIWSLISRDDSWELLSSKLTAKDLDAFEKLAVMVLGESDPRYDLPPKERLFASIKNKTPKFSSHLKKGIAETLVLLAVKNTHVVQTPVRPSFRVDKVVSKLLKGADWKRWASLNSNLSLLAEAAPDIFIAAVQHDLQSKKPEIPPLFVDEEESLMTGWCNHSGVLWALETLAWSPTYVTSAVLILARLDELDPPKSKWGNRPNATLREIFLPWMPQTAANADQRIEVLKKLLDKFQAVGLKLLLKLLPESYSTSGYTRQPSWREWALGVPARATGRDFVKVSEWCGEKLAEGLGKDGELWAAVIDRMENLPKKSFDALIEKLKTIQIEKLSKKTIEQVFDAVREKITRHRAFSDASWAMSAEMLTLLESIKTRFIPADLMIKHKWLFDSFPEIEEAREDYNRREEIIFKKRRDALVEILDEGDISKVLEFARIVSAPHSIGWTLGRANLLKWEDELIPGLLGAKDATLALLASGYISGRFYINNEPQWNWIKQFPLKKWTYEQVSAVLVLLPFEPTTWNLVESLGEKATASYWSARNSDIYRGKNLKELEYAVSMLLKYRRPFRAIDLLDMALHNKLVATSAVIMSALESALELSSEEAKEQIGSSERYRLQELFKFLQDQADVDRQRLASLEWAYLSVLDGRPEGVSPKTLHELIRSDPKFFSDLIARVFRSTNEPKKPVKAKEKAAGINAYKLLESLKWVPGTVEGGEVDSKKLKSWIDEAKTLCSKSGHIEVCDSRIGEMLAYSPSDKTDGAWPCVPIREVLEDGSEELRRGFQRGVYNKRGMHWRSMAEGGQQERLLEKQYSDWAEKIGFRWPSVGLVLRNIATGYQLEAQQRDEEDQA